MFQLLGTLLDWSDFSYRGLPYSKIFCLSWTARSNMPTLITRLGLSTIKSISKLHYLLSFIKSYFFLILFRITYSISIIFFYCTSLRLMSRWWTYTNLKVIIPIFHYIYTTNLILRICTKFIILMISLFLN